MGQPDTSSAKARRRRVLFLAVLGVLASLAAVFGVTQMRGGSGDGYNDSLRNEFVSACERASGDDATDTCRCTYDQLSQAIPYSRFIEIDQDVAAGGSLPEDIRDIVSSCG